MQLSREEITEKLKQILISAGNDKVADMEISEDLSLTDDLGIASVGMLYIVIAIEETFDIRFDDVGMNDFATVGDVLDYIEKLIK